MRCKKCGIENNKDSKYCTSCGVELKTSQNKNVVFIVLISFVVMILVAILWNVSVIINTGQNNSENEGYNNTNNEDNMQLSDSELGKYESFINMYDSPYGSNMGMGFFYKNMLLDVNKLSEEDKINISMHYALRTDKTLMVQQTFEPTYVDNIYKNVFGPNQEITSYIDIDAGCCRWGYNNIDNIYVQQGCGCGGTGPVARYTSKIISHQKDFDSIEIIVKEIFISDGYIIDGNDFYNIYDNEYNKQLITENVSFSDLNSVFDTFETPQYKFVFKKAIDGNYYFESVSRIK